MDRRAFIASFVSAALLAPRVAQAAGESALHLGTLVPGPPMSASSPYGQGLIEALGALGYVPDRNLRFEARGAVGDIVALPRLIEELRADGAQVLLTTGYPAAVAAKDSGMPTVAAWGVGDPVATGLVQSYAHPGGNLTGISDVAATLTAKRLELLKELAPQLRRIAMLWNKDDLGMSLRYEASAKTSQSLGVAVQPLGVREPEDFNDAFAAMIRNPPDAILMVTDSLTILNRKKIFDFATEHRLPAIYEYDFLVRDGGLMSYGPDLQESLRRAAAMIDRIFKGAHPGDLPFEQPTRYPFVINLKSARAIGIEPPPTLLALADEVIE